ncbi:hypothetical protein EYF80_025738 [Liparis tanakae]|uniref:Uncharacterized protein n=1 Tax=Liparis tanakae TaxID=230148 RepID=A0A4Z2HFE3_9TELE|nr:hypothetical protein EYF80_025738 [Liparis tanakae]
MLAKSEDKLLTRTAKRQSQISRLDEGPAARPSSCSRYCASTLLWPISSDSHVYAPACSGPMLSMRRRHCCSLQLHRVLLPR